MTSLRDPLTLPCGQVLPNRIMKAALSEWLGDKQNSPDERIDRLYTSWSQGGYGLIVTGNLMVDRTQLGEPGNVVIEDERNLDALSRWAKSTKDAGVPIWVQLNHPGRQSNPLALGHTPLAPARWPSAAHRTASRARTASHFCGRPKRRRSIRRDALCATSRRRVRPRNRPQGLRGRLAGSCQGFLAHIGDGDGLSCV